MVEYYTNLLFKALAYTYVVWGFAFSIQALLVMNKVKAAIKWTRKWYSAKGFYYEIVVFFPMIYISYVLFEILPALLGIDKKVVKFDVDHLVSNVFEDDEIFS